MTQAEAERLGDELRDLVVARTGLSGEALACPRERSEMTPCAVRDGGLTVTLTSTGEPICVGCEWHVAGLLNVERSHNEKRSEKKNGKRKRKAATHDDRVTRT